MIMSGLNTEKNSIASEISNGADATADIWNEQNPEHDPDKNMVDIIIFFLKLMIST